MYSVEVKNNKEIYDFCMINGITDINKFIQECFKQGFDIKRYGLLGETGEKEVIVEKIVEVPVEVIKEVEKIVEVIKEVPIEITKEIEVIKEVPFEKIVIKEIIKEVPVEKVIKVSDDTQVNELLKLFPVGKKIESDLIISKRGLPKGVKSGYKDFVEVSIAEQKLWLFKDGNLLLETDVVTGNKRRGRSTPLGEYSVKAKARNVVLRGRDYASFVSYWMPFHGGYGLHDANWRRRFGSQIYVSGGSHGCVNIPPKYAPLVYSNTNVGTPVIIVN